MIPKIIHYCWFGGQPLDAKSLKCISSWKKYCPDYEIVEWNEKNFDISQIPFMKKAYEEKKWAFVSDVARLIIVYEHGGIYLDTDVEIIRSYDDIIEKSNGFFGFESTGYVNSGLGFGSEKGAEFLRKLIEKYKGLSFEANIDNLSAIACPYIQTQLMEEFGFERIDRRQECCGFVIYPTEFFSPMEYSTGRIKKTELTHSIHWYNSSWSGEAAYRKQRLYQRCRRVFGTSTGDVIAAVCELIQQEGFFHFALTRIMKKMHKD